MDGSGETGVKRVWRGEVHGVGRVRCMGGGTCGLSFTSHTPSDIRDPEVEA